MQPQAFPPFRQIFMLDRRVLSCKLIYRLPWRPIMNAADSSMPIKIMFRESAATYIVECVHWYRGYSAVVRSKADTMLRTKTTFCATFQKDMAAKATAETFVPCLKYKWEETHWICLDISDYPRLRVGNAYCSRRLISSPTGTTYAPNIPGMTRQPYLWFSVLSNVSFKNNDAKPRN